MEFEWDKEKNDKNKDKHKLNFSDAKKVFDDSNQVTVRIEDSIDKYDEWRFITIGILYTTLHTVVWTFRSVFVRIISFRRSNKKEVKLYLNNINHE